jgi:hypothetical protein
MERNGNHSPRRIMKKSAMTLSQVRDSFQIVAGKLNSG